MTIESVNFIWGRAKNPWDVDRTPGGSSGGEAGLVAGGISPLGLGTDIGCSIRLPCTYCGIFGFKPSCGRLTMRGPVAPKFKEILMPNLLIRPSIGPMGKSTEDLAMMMQVLLD